MHYIRYEDLYDVVLNDIRQYAELAKDHEHDFVEALIKMGSDNTKKQLAQYEKELAKAEKCLSEINLIIKRLYENSVIGKVTNVQFTELSNVYEAENAELKTHVRELQEANSSYSEASDNSRQLTALIRKYFDVVALDALMLNDCVSIIKVYDREISDGER